MVRVQNYHFNQAFTDNAEKITGRLPTPHAPKSISFVNMNDIANSTNKVRAHQPKLNANSSHVDNIRKMHVYVAFIHLW